MPSLNSAGAKICRESRPCQFFSYESVSMDQRLKFMSPPSLPPSLPVVCDVTVAAAGAAEGGKAKSLP